jgi:hypothetical protein
MPASTRSRQIRKRLLIASAAAAVAAVALLAAVLGVVGMWSSSTLSQARAAWLYQVDASAHVTEAVIDPDLIAAHAVATLETGGLYTRGVSDLPRWWTPPGIQARLDLAAMLRQSTDVLHLIDDGGLTVKQRIEALNNLEDPGFAYPTARFMRLRLGGDVDPLD